jgi:hypothetical protein
MSRRKDWTYRFSNTDNQQQKEDKFYTIDEAEEVDDSKSDLLENEDEMLQVYAQKAKR